MALLEVKDLSVSFSSDGKLLPAVSDVSFSVEEGERVAILGPSGYGKSTLAKVIAGYLKPAGGEILWEGKPLPATGFCPIQLIYQHPEKALNPRWKMKDSLEEAVKCRLRSWHRPAISSISRSRLISFSVSVC